MSYLPDDDDDTTTTSNDTSQTDTDQSETEKPIYVPQQVIKSKNKQD